MSFWDGSFGQKAVFAALVGVYCLGLGIAIHDKLERVGAPDVGWVMEGTSLGPSRLDAARAGLAGGGRVLRLNEVELEGLLPRSEILPLIRRELGDTNTLTVIRAGGYVEEVTLAVRTWTWDDALYTEGVTAALGLLFVVVGVTSFLIRPFTPQGWGSLVFCVAIGELATVMTLPIYAEDVLKPLYYRSAVGIIVFVPLHAALVFPVVHPRLRKGPGVLYLIYALAAAHVVVQWVAWFTENAGPLRHIGGVDSTIISVTSLVFVGRCAALSLGGRDPLSAQRARILLAGGVFGIGPVVAINLARNTLSNVVFDPRLSFLSLTFMLFAMAYTTVRHDLLNARVAVRRSVIYACAVGVLTVLAILLVSVRPYAVALLLLPLLYWWPVFNTRLNAYLYPKRAHFPELVRAIGGEMAARTSVVEVLDVLATAPARLCDARSGVAFLFPGVAGLPEQIATNGGVDAGDPTTLPDEALVKLMGTTRKEVFRSQIAVEPLYANIQDECRAGFDRLDAEVLLPILQDGRVVGAMALGARKTGDVYEAAEIDALSTLAQQALQSIARIEATERLRARELEFADLKRFFPPAIIDQVMAEGGAAELRSQRKLVTVFFADLRGFTSFSDSVEPEEVMTTLAEYHGAVGRRIAEFSGTLERFVGDGFMVVFNDPVEQKDHVERAARMALAMSTDIESLREEWRRKGYEIDVGMGLHTGYATCGFIGYEGRRDYGVIGNVTNMAARLSDAAAGAEILVTAGVREELPGRYLTEPAGELTLKGFQRPQAAFRLLGNEPS
jgi:class 3 adenylate cyclase